MIRAAWWSALGLLVVIALAGCAAGSPSVASDPTATVPSAAQAITPVPTSLPPTPSPTAEPSSAPPETSTAGAGQDEGTPNEPAEEPTNDPTEPAGPTPRPEPPPDPGTGLSEIVERGSSGRDEVALTFDAGADRGYAEEILDTLDDYGIKASFGITGHWADENPDLVERMVDDGHMVFNHTWTHNSLTGASTVEWHPGVLDPDERRVEVVDTEEIIDEIADYDTAPYFRPPYGDYDDSVLADLAELGYWITVMWTCDSLGWQLASVEDIVDRCGSNASPGDIILLHVGADGTDYDALPALIENLRDQGLAFVTVEEILQP